MIGLSCLTKLVSCYHSNLVLIEIAVAAAILQQLITYMNCCFHSDMDIFDVLLSQQLRRYLSYIDCFQSKVNLNYS